MHFSIITDPAAYLQRVQEVLQRHEALNSVLLSIATRLASGRSAVGSTAAPLLCIVEDEGKVVGAALRTAPFNLVLGQTDSPIAIAVLADALTRQRIELPGIYAPQEAAATFVRAWSKLSRQRIHPGLITRIYAATRMNIPTGVPGVMRGATAPEQPLLAAWAEAFARETSVSGPSPALMVQTAMDEGRLYVWEDADRAVAMTVRGQTIPSGARINCVYTPPENRKRGYASALVANLCQQLLDSGMKMVTLNADVTNPTSNNVYLKIGFARVGDAREYRFENPI